MVTVDNVEKQKMVCAAELTIMKSGIRISMISHMPLLRDMLL